MLRKLVPIAVLALLVLPPAHAGTTIWSVDETVTVADAAHAATREWRVRYDATVYGSKWTLAIPPGATFASAHGAKGPLAAVVKDAEVSVTSDGPEFFVDFTQPLKREGAFVLVPGGPSAAGDSPTSVRYRFPAGWTLAGWTGSSGLAAPQDDAWSRTGPFFVEAALLEPGVADPGPDARGKAGGVARFADAKLGADKAVLDVTIVYDTDEFSPAWTLPLGAGLKLLGADAPFPNTTASTDGLGNVLVTAPYPFGHHLGPRPFTLHLATSPSRFGGGFLRTNLSIPAGASDPLTVRVDLGSLEWVGARAGETSLADQPTYATTGPMALSIVTLAPAPATIARFTEGPYIVEAPVAQADAARSAAKASAAALPAAAAFQPVGSIPLHVVYTDDPVFAWEEGLYHGHDAISIRASDLSPDATNLTPVRTLVHESTHALADRLRQGRALDNSFLNEGLARLAETHVEIANPSAVLKCVSEGLGGQRCTRDSSRVDAAKLQDFLKSGRTFDVDWNASSASEADRGFLYDYSGYVLLQYERAAPSGAIGRALQALATKTSPTSTNVIDALVHEAPGMTRAQLLYPGKAQASALAPQAFESAMGDAVAPPFPSTASAPVGFAKTPGAALGAVALAIAVLAVARRR